MGALTRELLDLARDLAIEAAKARFQKNFGTNQCLSCEGLKAGPGVTATCLQVRQCYFDNFKDAKPSPRQNRLIDSLSKGTNRS